MDEVEQLKKPKIRSFSAERLEVFYQTLVNLFRSDPKNQTRLINILNLWIEKDESKNLNSFLIYLDQYCKRVTVKKNDNLSKRKYQELRAEKINKYIALRDRIVRLLETSDRFNDFNPYHAKLWYEPKCVSNNFPFAQFFSNSRTKADIFKMQPDWIPVLKEVFFAYENTRLPRSDWEQFNLKDPEYLHSFIDFFHFFIRSEIEKKSNKIEIYTQFSRDFLLQLQKILTKLDKSERFITESHNLKILSIKQNYLFFEETIKNLEKSENKNKEVKVSSQIIPSELLSHFSLPAVIMPPKTTTESYEIKRQRYWDRFDIDNYQYILFENSTFVASSDILNESNTSNFYLRFEILNGDTEPKLYMSNNPYFHDQTRLANDIVYTYLHIDDSKLLLWKEWFGQYSKPYSRNSFMKI